MALLAVTYTRSAVQLEGRFLWTATATFAGESLSGQGYTKDEAVANLQKLINFARADSTTTENKEF